MESGIKKYEPIWGEWYVDSLIGKGSYGDVYKIYKTQNGKRIEAAAKYISIPRDENERNSIYSTGAAIDEDSFKSICDSRADTMSKEIKLMTALKGHDNIVGYEANLISEKKDEIGWDIIIRMELLTPLERYLAKNEFTVKDAVRLSVDICKAIDACNKNNIIHRDVKIENIFVDANGNFKLGDFGVSRTSSGKTTKGTVAGTESYMSPEMLKKEQYNSSIDIYSLGVVLYRLLNKKRNPFLPADGPITDADIEYAERRRIEGEVELPRPKFADDNLYAIIKKACAYDMHDRYSSALEMSNELEKVLEYADDTVVIAPRTAGKRRSAEKTYNEMIYPVKKKPILPIIIAACSLVAAILIGMLLVAFWPDKNNDEVVQNEIHATDIQNLVTDIVLAPSEEYVLSCKIVPNNAVDTLSFKSTDTNIVFVDSNGKIVGQAEGTADVVVTAGSVKRQVSVLVCSHLYGDKQFEKDHPHEGYYTCSKCSYVHKLNDFGHDENCDECRVKAEKIQLTYIGIKKPDGSEIQYVDSCYVGDEILIQANVVPEESNAEISCESSDETVVYVDEDGRIIALKEGTVSITLSADDVTRVFDITVLSAEQQASSSDTPPPVTVDNKEKCTHPSFRTEAEKVHPHPEYTVCNSCGANFGYNGVNRSSYKTEYSDVHPHKEYKYCLLCDYKESTNKTRKDSSCSTCNPKHVHSYGAVKYEDEHPHKGYKLCECGERVSVNDKLKDGDCSECYPCTHCDSTNHLTYEHEASDGWVLSLPSYVKNNKSKYIIDDKTQYRYKTRETTTSSKKSMSGWTLYDEDWEWSEYGSWSGWQDSDISETESRQVKTRDVVDVPGHYVYSYGAYVGDNGSGNKPCSYCATKETNRTPKEVWTSWSKEKAEIQLTKTTRSEWNYKCPYGCSHKGGQKFSTANSPDGRGAGYFWHDYVVDGYSDVFFWEETKYVDTTYKTQYKYQEREKVYTYYFEKWTVDSKWTDNEKSENEDRKLVESRTVYKWVLK